MIIGALGGSGTRVVTRLAKAGGVFMGRHLNEAEDSEPFQALYKTWLRRFVAQDGHLNPSDDKRLSEQFSDAVKAHLDKQAGAGPWGVKVPRSIVMLRLWQRQFPRFRFIHVVRNGLDMAYSADQRQRRMIGDLILSAAERGQDETAQALIYWCRVNTIAADFGENIMGSRYYRVRFEDLCDTPQEVCPELARFIENVNPEALLRAATEMLTPPVARERWKRQPAEKRHQLMRLGAGVLNRFSYQCK